MSDGQRFLLTSLYAVWLLVFGYAFIAYDRALVEGAGLSDEANRSVIYLGWQGVAGMLAVAVFGVGRGWPKGSAVRGLATVPLVIAVLHLLALGGVILWAENI